MDFRSDGAISAVGLHRKWFSLPCPEDTGTGRIELPFDCEGDRLVVYRNETAFVALVSGRDRDAIAALPGVRPLTDQEAGELEGGLPALALVDGATPHVPTGSRYFGLGDAIAWLAQRLGFSECDACSRRRRVLNWIPLWPLRQRR